MHDSKQAVACLRELIDGLHTRVGRAVPLEFRMDAAFFQRTILGLLARRRCAYAIKVGYWSWLPLKQLAADARTWLPVAPGVTGFEHDLTIPQWNLRLRVMIYRKHVQHQTAKNFQLDLFTPDDGHFEYGAVATNMTLGLPALFAFACGRGAHEKTLAELKGEFALDVVPTNHYGANSAWQQLSVLAYNLARNFQLDTLAEPKRRSRKQPTPISCAACERFASWSSPALAVSPASGAATFSGSPRIRSPRHSTLGSNMRSWPQLFSDQG